MPKLIDFGPGYGTVSYADDTPDEKIVADYDSLETERQKAIKQSKLINEQLAFEAEREQPSLEKTLVRTGLGIREGAAGGTKQALGSLLRAFTLPPVTPTSLQAPLTPINPEAPGAIAREAGKALESEGTTQLKEAQELGEGVGGGLGADIAQSFGTTLGISSPALLAAPLGIGVAATAAGLQSFGNTAAQFRDRLMELNPNLSEEQAWEKAQGPAALAGIATGVLTRGFGGVEKLLERISTEGLKKEGIKQLLREGFKSAAMEFPEEGLDQLSQGLLEKAYIDPSKSIGDIVNEAAMAGVTGFAAGGLTVGAITGPAKAHELITNKITEPSRMRQGTERRQGVLRAAIARGELLGEPSYAQKIGSEASTGGRPAQGLEQEAQGQVRLRSPEENRVEAVPGAEIRSASPEPTPPGQPQQFRPRGAEESLIDYAKAKREFDATQGNIVPPSYDWTVEEAQNAITSQEQQLQKAIADKNETKARWLKFQIQKNRGLLESRAQAEAEYNRLKSSASPEAGPPQQPTSPFAGKTVEQVGAEILPLTAEQWGQYLSDKDGLTRGAYRLGLNINDQAELQGLLRQRALAEGQMREAITTGDLDGMSAAATKSQFFREAYEAATDTGSAAGEAGWRRAFPGATAPFGAMSLKSTAESTVTQPSKEAGTISYALRGEQAPMEWEKYVLSIGEGAGQIHALSLPAIETAIRKGEINAGEGVNDVLLHLLQHSDLHPLSAVEVFDLSPQQRNEQLPSWQRMGPYGHRGLFTYSSKSPVGRIEIMTKDYQGNRFTQNEFLRILTHELAHNAVESKLDNAAPELRAEIEQLRILAGKASINQGLEWHRQNALSSYQEFLVEALSRKEFQEFLSKLPYQEGEGQPSMTVWEKFLDIVRRVIGAPEYFKRPSGEIVKVVTALDKVFRIAGELEQIERKAYNPLGQEQMAASPAETSRSASPEPGPKIAQTQVAGAAAQIGRTAEDIYTQREAGGLQLENVAYQKKQFKTARNELNRVSGLATGALLAEGLNPTENAEMFPDPSEGVGISEDGQIEADNAFVEKLNRAGVPNTGNIQDMQREIFYENSANRVNSIREKVATLEQALTYYQGLGVTQETINKKIQGPLDRLRQKLNRLESAELNGRTVRERADEIRDAETQRQESLGQQQALGLDPVKDFFGKQVGSYRDFLQKGQAAEQMANALRSQATSPDAMAAVLEQTKGWVTLPQDVQAAILQGSTLTAEQRASAFAALADSFEDFEQERQKMLDMQAARAEPIAKEKRRLLDKIAKAKIESGMSDVFIKDVLDTMEGDSGWTGSLQSQERVDELKQHISAIKSFALGLHNTLETNGALFDWLTEPSGRPPAINPSSVGVSQAVLDMITKEAQRNPTFASAILTLVNSADTRLANMPATQIKQIEDLLKLATPEAQAQAEQLSAQMLRRARAQASITESAQRENLKKLDALAIEEKALANGVAMFSELADSPDFAAIRNAVAASPQGYTEKMVLQNNTATTLKGFGTPKTPGHPGLVIKATDNPVLKSEWHRKIAQWNKAAQEYIDGYDQAQIAFDTNPITNQPPMSLGYDPAVVRGLRYAVSRFTPGSFLEISLLSENSRWKVPWLSRQLSKLSWFRQHDLVSKLVGGLAGTDLRTRLSDFVNHFLAARGVIQDYRDMPDLLHKAMKSHPESGMNPVEYRNIFNEIAHWGRMFDSPVKTGFVLPNSGLTVTPEDMALLKRQIDFEEALRRRVKETNVTSGIVVRRGGRELVRSGAYVGELGLPRHLNRQANSFIADVLQAYGAPVAGFDETTDLSASSDNDVVKFWNRNPELLVQHVLDSERIDRAMRLSPQMATTESTAARNWQINGRPTINTLEDLVAALHDSFPRNGMLARKEIIKGLNDELRQYRDSAKSIENDRAEAAQTRSEVNVVFSSANEFTQPAAKLMLPSSYYDYGAVTPGDFMATTSRANHDRIIAYASAVNRAIREIENRNARRLSGELTPKEAAEHYGGNEKEMNDVLGILRKISNDFEAAYRSGNPELTQAKWYKEGFGLLTSLVLALPTVNIRNMVQGQQEVYAMSRAMGLSGQWLSIWRTLKNVPKTLIRHALTIGRNAVSPLDSAKAFITGRDSEVFQNAVDVFANLIGQPDYRTSGQRVHQLGFDAKDTLLNQFKRIWQAASEISPEDEAALTIKGMKVKSLAALPARAIRAITDSIGLPLSDTSINGSLLTYAHWLEKRLKEVAMNYGAERERQGLRNFDSTNSAWELKPNEWATFLTDQDNRDSLANFRLFLEGSASSEGFQLEKNLWDYYQKSKDGQEHSMFDERQFDAVQRRLISEFNAATPANRSSSAAGNNVIRNLLTLQGYSSDLLLKLINHFGGTRDRKALSAMLTKLPMAASFALMTIVLGLLAVTATGGWEKWVRKRLPTLPTPLDADFWSSWSRMKEGTLSAALSQLVYAGDIALGIRNEIVNNRGYDPVGRVFTLGIIQRALNTVRGMWSTARGAGSLGQILVPLADFGRSTVPYWLEAERVFNSTQSEIKQGQRLVTGVAQTEGLLPNRVAGPLGPTYGPTTVVRRALGDAVSDMYRAEKAGDKKGYDAAVKTAQAQMQQLEDYYARKYIDAGDDEATAREKAQKDVWNAYQEINPVVAGMLGKRPTEAQYDLILKGITGERGRVLQQGIDAWQSGAMALFGKLGSITKEDVQANRSGGALGSPIRELVPAGATSALRSIQRSMKIFQKPRAIRAASGVLRPARPARPGGASIGIRAPGIRVRAGRIGRRPTGYVGGPRLRSPRVSRGRTRARPSRLRRPSYA